MNRPPSDPPRAAATLNLMQQPCMNKMAAPKRQRSPSAGSRKVVRVAGRSDREEYWVQCPSCRSIVKIPYGGAQQCACRTTFRWPKSVSPHAPVLPAHADESG
jgi:hypothetical protein